MKRFRLSLKPVILALVAAFGLTSTAAASPSFPAELDQLCSSQFRVPPNPAELARLSNPPSGDCALCHQFDASLGETPDASNVTPAGEAFLTGAIDVFCAPGNQPPVIEPIDDVTGDVGQLILINVHATDPEGRRITLTASGLPTGARFVTDGNNNGSFSWTPTTDQGGSYIVTFIATDRGTPVRTTSLEVTLSIGSVNRPPVLRPIGPFAVLVGSPLEIALEASDPDGDELEFSVDPLPSGASLQPLSTTTATFAWTPDASQIGNHELTFAATDMLLLDDETIVVTVGAVNVPPVLTPIGDRVVDVGATLAIEIFASDADQDTLSFSVQGLPAGAVLTDHGDGTAAIEWMPEEVGVHVVTVTVTDDGVPAESASETFAIEAEEPPPAETTLVLIDARWMTFGGGRLGVWGEGAVPGALVTLFDSTLGLLLGSTAADTTGGFQLILETPFVPCAVLASSNKEVSAPRDVLGAGSGCSAELRIRVVDARWRCAEQLLQVLGDHAPAGALIRFYEDGSATPFAEMRADQRGHFYLRVGLDHAPGLIQLGVELSGAEWTQDVSVLEVGDCRPPAGAGCGDHGKKLGLRTARDGGKHGLALAIGRRADHDHDRGRKDTRHR